MSTPAISSTTGRPAFPSTLCAFVLLISRLRDALQATQQRLNEALKDLQARR